ncbi:MAG: DUF3841 domain-containing protein, partial [Bacillota bacterium]|nr:DUF3841 domain-containing protein [Bacillota bacterium]
QEPESLDLYAFSRNFLADFFSGIYLRLVDVVSTKRYTSLARIGERMLLWTVQAYDFWEILQRDGVYRTDPSLVDPDFLFAYQWLVDVMKQRIGNPPEDYMFPVWAWYQWRGPKRRKPDLRSGGFIGKREKGVRIEFELEDSQVLLSDFDLWHFVLNYWYLPYNEEDHKRFEEELEKKGISYYNQKPLADIDAHQKIVRSWERIFDLSWVDEKGYVAYPAEEKSVQATFWELRIDQVRKVKEFRQR